MKVGAAVALTALAAYGGYRLYQSGALDNLIAEGKEYLKSNKLSTDIPKVGSTVKLDTSTKQARPFKILKTLPKPESIEEAIKNANPNRNSKP